METVYHILFQLRRLATVTLAKATTIIAIWTHCSIWSGCIFGHGDSCYATVDFLRGFMGSNTLSYYCCYQLARPLQHKIYMGLYCTRIFHNVEH